MADRLHPQTNEQTNELTNYLAHGVELRIKPKMLCSGGPIRFINAQKNLFSTGASAIGRISPRPPAKAPTSPARRVGRPDAGSGRVTGKDVNEVTALKNTQSVKPKRPTTLSFWLFSCIFWVVLSGSLLKAALHLRSSQAFIVEHGFRPKADSVRADFAGQHCHMTDQLENFHTILAADALTFCYPLGNAVAEPIPTDACDGDGSTLYSNWLCRLQPASESNLWH